MSKHSLPPWRVSKTYPEGQFRITSAAERVGDTAQAKSVATFYSAEDADFVNLAANNFEELRDAADDALNTLIGCCIPAGGCDDRKTILDTQMRLRKILADCGVSYSEEAE